MSSANDQEVLRFEVKVPVPAIRFQQVQLWLRRHPMLFSEIFAPRIVNSLYLDSCDLQRFVENLNGISERKKIRIRWYGDLADPTNAKLEFKLRKSGKGRKVVYPAPIVHLDKETRWKPLLDDCFSHLPLEGLSSLGNGVMPILICRYERAYFMSACGKIRVTIDRNIEVYDQRYGDRVNIEKGRSLGHYYLLEFKCEAGYEEELSQLISTCPMRPTRHSKYVNGIRRILWK